MAAGAPLLVLLALEGTLRVAGYGKRTELFIPDGRPGVYRTNPDFALPYFPARFDIAPLDFRITRHKEPGTLRIFVLGESAVRGTPEPGFGFAAQLRAQLRAAYPGRRFEVCNLGMVAIDSHTVYRMAREAAEFEPDLFIVYMGNNEVVGPYGPGSVSASWMPPLALVRAALWTRGTRTGQLIAALAGRFAAHAGGSPDWRGMSTFAGSTVRGDDPRIGVVYRNYEANLRDILAFASRRGIRTIVATVVANLRDSPPFASLHRPGMTPTETTAWTAAQERGLRLWELGLTDPAIDSLSEALRLDPGYADTRFVLGRLLESKGDIPAARAQYLEALHWDALRFRPDAPINAIARRVASAFPGTVALLDAALEMGADAASAAPPSGRGILLEHVHFNWQGNRRMGRMLAEKAAAAILGGSPPAGAWLDDAGCASAVGYTAYGRLRVLRLMAAIWGKPPFTNQLTFGEDQIRLGRELELASAEATTPEGLSNARETIAAAARGDPDNPTLGLQLARLDAESGSPAEALQSVDRVLELVPRVPEVLLERARILASLERISEAQATVLESLRLDPNDLPSYSALVEVLRKTGDFETGNRVFSGALAANPDSSYLRLAYADLLFFHGDRNAAVGECQVVLGRDPANPDALRRLVSLFTGEGRTDEAFDLMTQARRTQPLNFENDMALALIYRDRNDDAHLAECLADAARGGPADAKVHLYLSSRYREANKPAEALVELARAERAATLMGEDALAKRISDSRRSGEPAR